MDLHQVWSGMDFLAWRGMAYTLVLLNFVFACQLLLLLLQPVVSAALDGQSVDAAELFERASQSIKVKRYSHALDDRSLFLAIFAGKEMAEAPSSFKNLSEKARS